MPYDTARPTFSEAYAAAYQGCQGPNPLASIRELQRLRAEVLKGDERLIFLADCEASGVEPY